MVVRTNEWVVYPLDPGQTSALQIKTRSALAVQCLFLKWGMGNCVVKLNSLDSFIRTG